MRLGAYFFGGETFSHAELVQLELIQTSHRERRVYWPAILLTSSWLHGYWKLSAALVISFVSRCCICWTLRYTQENTCLSHGAGFLITCAWC